MHGFDTGCIERPLTNLVRPDATEYECNTELSTLSTPIGARLMIDSFTDPDGTTPDFALVPQQLLNRTYEDFVPDLLS